MKLLKVKKIEGFKKFYIDGDFVDSVEIEANEESLYYFITNNIDTDELIEALYCDEVVEIFGNEYSAIKVLKEVDPLAYHCNIEDAAISQIVDDIFYEISNYGYFTGYGLQFEEMDEEEEG